MRRGWAQLGAALPRTRANVLALCAELGVAGVTALAEGLAESSLIWLHLGHRMSTGMGVAGALALAAALPHSKLRGLKIEGVQGAQDEIGEEGRAALEDAAALADPSSVSARRRFVPRVRGIVELVGRILKCGF